MNRTDAISWMLLVCTGCLRLSQVKTLSQLVAAALFVERANLASIGRALSGPAKHQIKKVCRFIANSRIEPADAMRGVVCHLLRHRSPRKPGKPLVVSLDWTDIKAFSTLTASAVFKGRSVPICWASCLKHVYEGHRSRNAFEESLLRVVRTMIPPYVKVILVADRGFGRTELARFCQHQGFDYVIRIQPNVHVRCECYRGKLIDYPVRPGVCRLLRSVAYRSHHQVIQHIVVRWVRNLPQERDECWFLMTSLRCGPAVISRLYATRMTIEQLFRDVKNKRNGWSLRDTKITRADRLDRLLLILALSYILLCGLGLLLLATRHPGEWSSSSRNDCSVFTIGRIMVHRVHLPIPQLIRRLQTSLAWLDGNWG